jgi:MinD-like ATPase involved in chromosome partitioning or flagellar assembly
MSLFSTLEPLAAEPDGPFESIESDGAMTHPQQLISAKTDAAVTTVCVWGPAASGKSMLALNLATELALSGSRVLLVDADAQFPSLALMLGSVQPAPGLTAALRLAGQGRLNSEHWQRVAESIELPTASFDFLAGISNPSRWPELKPAALKSLLEWLDGHYDWVIFDCDRNLEAALNTDSEQPQRNAMANNLVRECDLVLALCPGDVIGTNRFLWQLQSLPPKRFTVVANRVRASALGRHPERQLADTLHQFAQLRPHCYLPEDPSCDQALMLGQPLWLAAKNSKLREAIRLLAQDLPNL